MFRRIDLPWLTHLSSSPRYYAVKGPWFLISCKLCLLTHHHPLSALTCGKLQSSPGLWICFYSQISDSVCDSSLGKSLFLIISCSELKEKAELFPLMSLPWHFRFTLYPPTTKPRQGRFSASPIWGGGFPRKMGQTLWWARESRYWRSLLPTSRPEYHFLSIPSTATQTSTRFS